MAEESITEAVRRVDFYHNALENKKSWFANLMRLLYLLDIFNFKLVGYVVI